MLGSNLSFLMYRLKHCQRSQRNCVLLTTVNDNTAYNRPSKYFSLMKNIQCTAQVPKNSLINLRGLLIICYLFFLHCQCWQREMCVATWLQYQILCVQLLFSQQALITCLPSLFAFCNHSNNTFKTQIASTNRHFSTGQPRIRVILTREVLTSNDPAAV